MVAKDRLRMEKELVEDISTWEKKTLVEMVSGDMEDVYKDMNDEELQDEYDRLKERNK
jgi:hypothetical protein